MTTYTTRLALAALLVPLAAGPARAQDAFNWTGRVGAAQTLEIKGISGDIVASAASGDEIRVQARKTARRSDPEDVRIEVVEHSGGVTICALYPPARNREPNECRPGRGGRNSSRNNDVRVDFTIEVPRGVRFVGRTVNGEVSARGLQGEVDVSTVNGSVDVSTSGLARASTVNGSIDVTLGRTDWSGPLEFETVNGAVTVTFAGDVDADVTASTVNGSISTDFPLTVRGRFGPKRLTGTIGDGGRPLVLTTVNGDISLRRR